MVTCLTIVLAVWRFSEKTLSASNIKTTKAELFYWVAILFSNTLGTALGDFLADDSGLGFLGGAALIGGIIVLIALAKYVTRLNRTMLFWLAFVLTRPFGAVFGDLLTKPLEKGGVGFGTIGSSAILAILLVVFVTHTVAAEKRLSEDKLAWPSHFGGCFYFRQTRALSFKQRPQHGISKKRKH